MAGRNDDPMEGIQGSGDMDGGPELVPRDRRREGRLYTSMAEAARNVDDPLTGAVMQEGSAPQEGTTTTKSNTEG